MTNTTKNFDDFELQQIASDMLNRELYFNALPLVDFIIGSSQLCDCNGIPSEAPFTIDDIENNFYTTEDQEVIDEEAEEGDYKEVYEWYAVSYWLYNKLKDQREVVLHACDDCYFWGRQCTGQAVKLDHVIQQIAINYSKEAKK